MSKKEVPADAIIVPGVNRIYKRRRILVVLMMELAMALMAISSINVALPAIEAGIGASDTDIQLLLSGYALTFGVILVMAGRIGDTIGRSSMFVIGVTIYALASLGCGLAISPEMLNIFRFIQGIGAGISSPQVNGIIVAYFSGRKRAIAFSYFGLVVSVSVAISPLLTGLFIRWLGNELGWRASFLWNVPVGLGAAVLAFFWLPFGTEIARRNAKSQGIDITQRLDFDPVGMILLGATVVCIMLPFLAKQPAVFTLLILGAILGYIWVRWEKRYKSQGKAPMVDLALFKHRSYTHAIMVSGTQFLGTTSVFAILALYLQTGLHASALAVGLISLPNAVCSGLSSLWAGPRVFDRGRTIIIGAFGVYILGLLTTIVLAHFMDPAGAGISYWWMAVPLVLTGLGVGSINTCNQTLSQSDIPPEIGGTSGAVKQVAERMGTAIGNTAITAVLFSLVHHSWTVGFTGAFIAITMLVCLALGFAIMDLRTLGDPGKQAAV